MLKVTPLLLLSSVALLFGCKEEPPVPEPESRPAKLISVSAGGKNFTRTFPSVAEAGDKAILAFRVPGQLHQLKVRAGTPVKKGDVLAQLNPDEYQLLQKQAKANFELANVQYQRMKTLRKDKVVSEQDFDQALANYKSSNATLEQATANLNYTRLIAPYDGTVSIVNVENYEFVNVSQPIMNVQTTQVLKIVFQLPGYLLNRFAKDAVVEASVTFDSFPQESFPVQFLEIDTEADSKTNSFKTTMVMNKPDDIGILPGMSGQLKLTIPKSDASTLPESALFEEGGKQFVWRVKSDGVVEKVEVELSPDGAVQTGLTDGDLVVASGVDGIEPGIKVREWVKERGL